MTRIRFILFLSFFILLFVSLQSNLTAANDDVKPMLSKGQTIYVPAYSHIYYGNREKPFSLTITLSIRNIDTDKEIKIILADYYETQGKLVKKFVKDPVVLKPLESLRYVIPESDKVGGSGANFIVKWNSDKLANPPLIESVMISTHSSQGISFTSRGREIISSKQ